MGRYKLPYSIYKRGKYWYYRTYTVDGLRTTAKSTGCRTKGEAVQFCESLLINGSLSDSNISFAAYSLHFFDDDSFYVKDRITPLSENTIKGHRAKFRYSIYPFFKDYKLKDINYIELKKYRGSLIDKGMKKGSIKEYLTTLKIILDSAYKEDLISRNPFDKLESLGEGEEEQKKAFTLDQVKQLYNSIEPKYKNLVLILALTGMRINEALGVTDADVFTTEKNTDYIKLNKQLNNKKEYVRIKTKRNRDVPIIPELKGKFYHKENSYKSAYKYFRCIILELYGEDANLSIHSLRHFYFTSSKAKNINPDKIKIIGGHVLDGSEHTYTNFTPDDLIDILPWQKEVYDYVTK